MVILLLPAFAFAPAGSPAVQLSLPKYRLQADELAVIVNDADPLSVKIGEYYRQARGLPDENLLHVRFEPGARRMTAERFEALRATVVNATPAHIQAYAITWAAPFRVECMSITSALTFGFDRQWCSHRTCAPTRHSPLFNYSGAAPWTDLGVRPSISIAATGFAEARELIDRGVASDGSLPAGTAYLVSTSDKARNVRAGYYPLIAALMSDRLATQIVESDALRDRDDVLFYFTGKSRVDHLDTLRFLPGAIADHLTSAGGKLTGSRQMSALRWLQAGATGSYGTVVEPCNLRGKFPHPGIVMERYTAGRTLIEAYWQSVQQPGEGIFIGEPLAAPFDHVSIEIRDGRIHLATHSLPPGAYRLMYAQYPVGPWRQVATLAVHRHQGRFRLPHAGDGYYRLVDAGDSPPDLF